MQVLKEIMANNQARFASFTYRAKTSGELARYVVQLGINYGKVLEKSALGLELTPATNEPEIQAKNELLASFGESIQKHSIGQQNSAYTKAGQYISLGNGVNVNSVDGSLQIMGLIRSKVTIEPGQHKAVKSSAKTIAKNHFRKQLPIGRGANLPLRI